MGLEDLIPDDVPKSSSSRTTSKSKKDTVTFGSGELKKEFEKEHWEEIKEVLIEEMGLVPNEVVNNYAAQERYEILHEAALITRQEATIEELGHTVKKCDICGRPLGESGVEVAGINVCISHTAGQIHNQLNGD